MLTTGQIVFAVGAHNERRQFASQTRSCGCLPRGGKHCSLPGFASLNRGPTLATPQRRPLQGSPQKSAHSRFYYADSLIGIQ